ncbi:hypothetical protein OAS20_02535 [Gammaproteobacteria bacterium]|nr:hypothetical protein [Gammaproteobacteria bacterium]
MPYKDVTYENGLTERFYYDETLHEEALRMSRTNSVSKFPSVNAKPAASNSTKERNKCEDTLSNARKVIS